jgi:hypothetical protein
MVTRPLRPSLVWLVVPCLLACSEGTSGGAGEPDAGVTPILETLTHRFDPVNAGPGEERSWICQSWSLNNPEPLLVHAVRQQNDGGWHHSNWFFVPGDVYDGPDGTWGCSERGFDEVSAGLAGGVFFAQSTQARAEEQRFPDGFAIRLPANARIVGSIHILNLLDEAIETSIELEADVIDEEHLTAALQPMSFTNMALEIPNRSLSEFSMDCAFSQSTSFDVHYVLAHYHEWGNLLRLEVIGGEQDGEPLFETTSATGEPLGSTLDPPFEVTGATGLRLTCGYDNPDDRTIGYGIGDQEMCVFLAYLSGPTKFAGAAFEDTSEYVGETDDGVQLYEAPCNMIAVPGN